jgi:hypothetical protein
MSPVAAADAGRRLEAMLWPMPYLGGPSAWPSRAGDRLSPHDPQNVVFNAAQIDEARAELARPKELQPELSLVWIAHAVLRLAQATA